MKNGIRYALSQSVTRGAAWGLALCSLAVTAVPASAAERSLAGIRIFSSARAILQKYKNPTQVIVGRPSLFPVGSSAGGASAGTTGPGGPPPGTPGFGGAPGALPGFGGGGPAGDFGGNAGGFAGALMGEGGGPPMMGGPAAGGAAAGTDPNGSNPGEVTWIYDKPNGNDLEFTMASDGRVIQVRATGFKNGAVRTTKGVTLGQTYAQVIGKYGYPESQEQMGTVLTARYTDSQHVAFQFYNQRLVAIIVAAVE